MTATTNGKDTRHNLSESNVKKKKKKDLDDIVDSNLNFSNHISQATRKANHKLGVFLRPFASDKTFIQLYKLLVRPMLEYGHSI